MTQFDFICINSIRFSFNCMIITTIIYEAILYPNFLGVSYNFHEYDFKCGSILTMMMIGLPQCLCNDDKMGSISILYAKYVNGLFL